MNKKVLLAAVAVTSTATYGHSPISFYLFNFSMFSNMKKVVLLVLMTMLSLGVFAQSDFNAFSDVCIKASGRNVVVYVVGSKDIKESYFLLQTKTEVNINNNIANCNIILEKNRLILSNSKESFVLKLSDNETIENKASILFTGFGLAFNTNAMALTMLRESVKLNDTHFPDIEGLSCLCAQNGSGTGCSSGGVGATGCGITDSSIGVATVNASGGGCSVNCGAGYYACCNK